MYVHYVPSFVVVGGAHGGEPGVDLRADVELPLARRFLDLKRGKRKFRKSRIKMKILTIFYVP